MKNLLVERDVSAILDFGASIEATLFCLNPTEPKLYLATTECEVVCVSLDTLKVSGS